MEPLDHVTTRRMVLASNILQDQRYVQVISFDPPVREGGEGLLHVRCPSEVDYQVIRRFLDEEHGSALKSMTGDLWYVHRISDDAQLDEPFPQHVKIRVEWRFST
jgi:hypothetical protein